MKTSIQEYLEESARKYPDKTAFADEHTSCTFKELEQTARRTGTALAKHFTPRNPVPVFMGTDFYSSKDFRRCDQLYTSCQGDKYCKNN